MPGVMGWPPAERQGSAIRSMGQKLRSRNRAQDRERKMCVCLVDGMNYVQPESVVWDIRGEVRASEPLNTSP